MATAGVTVMGGGIFGLACAWECLQRGAKVRLIEAKAIGAGASGGLVGALAPHVPEQWNPKKQFQLEALLMAGAFWAGVGAASGIDPGYARSGRLQPLDDDDAVRRARQRGESAAELWGNHATWRVIPADGRQAGWEPHARSGWLVEDTLTARLHPRQAAAALAGAIRAGGGEIILGQTAPPDIGSGPVIWATGVAGLAALSVDVGRPLGSAEKGQALLLAPAAAVTRTGPASPSGPPVDLANRPQLFADSVHIVPHADGTVAIGSTSERSFTAPDSTDHLLDDVLARAVAICPALQHMVVIDRWAGLRPRAVTRAPVLGGWPGRPGHFIANGGFKIGFGIAPKVAAVMADLVLDGHDAVPPGFHVADALAR